jgi:uncharacterized protein (TIGR02147 family)
MNAQKELIKLLRTEFDNACVRNPNYSLRSFARTLKIPVSSLSEIMNGKYPISRKRGRQILEAFQIPDPVFQNLLKQLERKNMLGNFQSERQYIEFDQDQYCLLSEWHYLAIISLTELNDFQDAPEWIAERLSISLAKAEEAIERMVRLGVLEVSSSGIKSTGRQLKTISHIPNAAIKMGHSESLDLARKSLEKTPIDLCNFSSMTMAIDPAKVPEAEELIKKFRHNICQFLEKDEKKSVYRLAIQLFPLEKIEQT